MGTKPGLYGLRIDYDPSLFHGLEEVHDISSSTLDYCNSLWVWAHAHTRGWPTLFNVTENWLYIILTIFCQIPKQPFHYFLFNSFIHTLQTKIFILLQNMTSNKICTHVRQILNLLKHMYNLQIFRHLLFFRPFLKNGYELK